MRWPVFACLALVLGCKVDNPKFESGETEGTTDGGETAAGDGDGDAGSGGTSSGDGDGDAGGASEAGSGDGDGDGDGDGTSSTTGVDPGTTGNGTTTGDPATCPEFDERPFVDVDVNVDEVTPYDGCEGPLDVTGYIELWDDNPLGFTLYACDGGTTNACTGSCDTVSYDIVLKVPAQAAEYIPLISECAHVRLEFFDQDRECAFKAGALWEADVEVPALVLGTRGSKAPAGVGPMEVGYEALENCDCENGTDCCLVDPGQYKIGFGGFDEGYLTLYEGEPNMEAHLGGDLFTLVNVGSHVVPACGVRPNMDWAIRAEY